MKWEGPKLISLSVVEIAKKKVLTIPIKKQNVW